MKELKFIYEPNEEKPEYVKFASGIVHRASEFRSNITLKTQCVNGYDSVDLKSILGVMSLHSGKGKAMTIEINGIDEDEAYMSLKAYVEK